MTITFLSNYINHHQIPFCDACCRELGEDFRFIQTQPMEQERIDMGWDTKAVTLPYVLCLYEEEERCLRLILESDILLAGWTGREDLIEERMKRGRATIGSASGFTGKGSGRLSLPGG